MRILSTVFGSPFEISALFLEVLVEMDPGAPVGNNQVTEMMKRLTQQQGQMNSLRAKMLEDAVLFAYADIRKKALQADVDAYTKEIKNARPIPWKASTVKILEDKLARTQASLNKLQTLIDNKNTTQIRSEMQGNGTLEEEARKQVKKNQQTIKRYNFGVPRSIESKIIINDAKFGGRRKSRSHKRTLRKHKCTLRKHKRRTNKR